ncbi:MAG: DUF1631 family protein [Nevskia sp.]|nr:DUF1631 family protein [Nevskia sp.]
MEDTRSSKVHPLFPNQAPGRGERGGAFEAPSHPVAVELKNAAQRVLDELLLRMFESADDYLFELGEKSPNDSERRRYFDTMRVLRLDRAKVTLAFGEDLVRGFAPTVRRPQAAPAQEFDLDSLSIQPTEELEEKIALSNMATKAEGLHKGMIWEVERRLESAARDLGVPLSPTALSPARICEAFGKGTGALATDFSIKLVVYKLFDRVVIQDLGRLYTAALEVLDRHGINATRRPVAPPPPPEAAPPPPAPGYAPPAAAGPQAAGAAPGYVPPAYPQSGYTPPGYTPPGAAAPSAGWSAANWSTATAPGWAAAQTQEFLRNFGLDQLTLQRSAGPLATEFSNLLQALFTQPPPPAMQASAQRLTLAGKLFDDILSEPLLPEPLRPAIEKLRYPVYRTALTDANFFANQSHPLRKLLSDLVELSVSAQSSETAQQQLREVLRAAAALHSEGPALMPDAVRNTQAVPEGDVDNFLLQMREQTRSRRDALLMRVRRLVAQELEVQTLGREVPQPVMQLLRGGVGPLMAVRLLKNGRGSPLYREAQALMERVLRSLEYIPPPTEEELRSREQLMSGIVTSLADIGMLEDKIESLLNGLQGVYALLDEPERMRRASDRAGERRPDRPERSPRPDPNAAPAAPPPPPAPGQPAAERGELPAERVMELLRRVLAPDSWFRVYHAEQNQTRWLKLNSFYPERDAVTFTGFDETQKLNLRAYRFAEDLARGHSEPINPDESARDAVDQLREAKALGLI